MDEIIGEVETDKTALPVMSPVSGILTELLVEEGGKVTPYQEIFKIDEKPVEEVKETAPKSDPVAPPQPTSPPPPPVSLCLSVQVHIAFAEFLHYNAYISMDRRI